MKRLFLIFSPPLFHGSLNPLWSDFFITINEEKKFSSIHKHCDLYHCQYNNFHEFTQPHKQGITIEFHSQFGQHSDIHTLLHGPLQNQHYGHLEKCKLYVLNASWNQVCHPSMSKQIQGFFTCSPKPSSKVTLAQYVNKFNGNQIVF